MELDFGQPIIVGSALIFPDWTGAITPQSTIDNPVIGGSIISSSASIQGTYESLGQPGESSL